MLQRMTPALSIPNQRRYQRINLDLPVRFMTEGGVSEGARLLNISLGGAAIYDYQRPQIGSGIVAYVDRVDRFQGTVVRLFRNGFAMQFALSERKRDRLSDALTWLANEGAMKLKANRRRFIRSANAGKVVKCHFEDGQISECSIVDCSLAGASLKSSARPFIGMQVTVGQTKARVVRHTSEGFAVEFSEYWRLRPPTDSFVLH